jgi:amidohydrolase
MTALQLDLVKLRRDLHAHPEIGLHLPRTQQKVLEALSDLDLEISLGRELSSVTAVLRGGRPGPAVLLRADMDALPVSELTGVEYASGIEGAMHACGHDLHTAMLVGAARILAGRRADLAGDVVLMFQPGEEGWDGAARMIAEGVLDAAGERVRAAYGLHVRAQGSSSGKFQGRSGPIMGGSDPFEVTVQGTRGHGSLPHLANDPVTVAAALVTAIPMLVTRRFDALDPVVVSIGSVRAGDSPATIPEQASLAGTIRTFSEVNRRRVRGELTRLVESTAEAYGMKASITIGDGYPVTINSPAPYALAAQTVREELGDERFDPLAGPVPAGEDFARVLAEVPGCFLLLDASVGDDPAANHSPYAVFDDGVLSDGALVLASLASRSLGSADLR